MINNLINDFNKVSMKAEYISQLVIKELIYKTQNILKSPPKNTPIKYFLNLTGLFDLAYNATFYSLFKRKDIVKIDFTEVNYKYLEDSQGYFKDTYRKIDFFIDTEENLVHTTINGSVKGIPTKIMNVDIEALYRELDVNFHVTFPINFFEIYDEDKYQLDLIIAEYVDEKLKDALKNSELLHKLDLITENIHLIRKYDLEITSDFVTYLEEFVSLSKDTSLMLYSNSFFRKFILDIHSFKQEIHYLFTEIFKLNQKTMKI